VSDTVTISSGVYVGTRGDGPLTSAWFAGTPTTEFTTFTLKVTDTQVVAGISGMPSRRKPIMLRLAGSGLSTVEDDLHAIEAYPLLNGQPRRTLSGFLDVVAGKGRLCKLALRLLGDSADRTEWGVIADLNVEVSGGMHGWTATCVFYPCDLLWWTGTDSVFIRPGVTGAPG
jgi:hypothetical protein